MCDLLAVPPGAGGDAERLVESDVRLPAASGPAVGHCERVLVEPPGNEWFEGGQVPDGVAVEDLGAQEVGRCPPSVWSGQLTMSRASVHRSGVGLEEVGESLVQLVGARVAAPHQYDPGAASNAASTACPKWALLSNERRQSSTSPNAVGTRTCATVHPASAKAAPAEARNASPAGSVVGDDPDVETGERRHPPADWHLRAGDAKDGRALEAVVQCHDIGWPFHDDGVAELDGCSEAPGEVPGEQHEVDPEGARNFGRSRR